VAKVKRLGKLQTIGDCITVLGKIARAAWSEELPASDAHKIASIVTMVRQAIEGDLLRRIQDRLDKLEGNNG
jgi:hypothetical protein